MTRILIAFLSLFMAASTAGCGNSKESAGDTPIISVSQKPMDLGNNICVGDVERSSQNGYMQLLIGCVKLLIGGL